MVVLNTRFEKLTSKDLFDHWEAKIFFMTCMLDASCRQLDQWEIQTDNIPAQYSGHQLPAMFQRYSTVVLSTDPRCRNMCQFNSGSELPSTYVMPPGYRRSRRLVLLWSTSASSSPSCFRTNHLLLSSEMILSRARSGVHLYCDVDISTLTHLLICTRITRHTVWSVFPIVSYVGHN